MLKIFKWQCILVGFLLSLTVNAHSQEHYRVPASTPPDSTAYWAWTTEPWTGDDKPYIQVRNNIDKAIAKGQKPDVLLAKYKLLAEKSPKVSVAQFAWGYAAYKAAKAEVRDYNKSQMSIGRARNAMEQLPSPRSYQYSRLHFLLAAAGLPQLELLDVGKRLAQRNAKDWDVKFYIVSIMMNGPHPNKQEALKYAQENVKANPKRPSSYTSLGSIYWWSWRQTGSKVDADKAIAAYRKYLQLERPNHEFRSIAERIIKRIQESQAKKCA